jgi:hypothetical protein
MVVIMPFEYRLGTFIDVSSRSAKVHDYRSMYALLKKLSERYPNDTEFFKVGESRGYGGSKNSLEIPGIHIKAAEQSERTAFVIAGHHPEYSGPEAAYLLAERLLAAYENRNSHVHQMRQNTHTTIIPQVNVDLYDNLEKYWEDSFGTRSYELAGTVEREPKDLEHNYYGSDNEYLDFYGVPPPKASKAVKKTVGKVIKEFGPPLLSLDFHEAARADYSLLMQTSRDDIVWRQVDLEGAIGDIAVQNGETDWDFFAVGGEEYALAKFPKYVIDEMDKVGSGRMHYNEKGKKDLNVFSFDTFMAFKGAESFLFEIESKLCLDEKIEKILVGTDRILARYFLGI